VEAATIAMNAQTAQQALRIVSPAPGTTIVVTGASGAVGGFAVQLAAAAGAHVIAVASTGDEEWVASLGAKEVLGRRSNEEVAAAVRLDEVEELVRRVCPAVQPASGLAALARSESASSPICR
jgi:NADPH:quinone reductase-like Zn-dependent oxidoreductase